MCDDAVARYACAATHEARGEEPERFKDIRRCLAAQHAGVTCSPDQRGRAHDWQDDDPSQECAECRGESPPITP